MSVRFNVPPASVHLIGFIYLIFHCPVSRTGLVKHVMSRKLASGKRAGRCTKAVPCRAACEKRHVPPLVRRMRRAAKYCLYTVYRISRDKWRCSNGREQCYGNPRESENCRCLTRSRPCGRTYIRHPTNNKRFRTCPKTTNMQVNHSIDLCIYEFGGSTNLVLLACD